MSNNKQQPKPENTNNQFSNTEPLTHAQRVAIANNMSNNKQSSVEWLVEKLGKYNEEMIFLYQNEIQEAKAMHKEETLKLYYAYEDYVLREEGIIKTFGQFYNETFGGNNEQQ